MSRQDQYNVTVVVGGSPSLSDLGTFDKMTGGEVDSTESKYRPGNMGDEISLGGYRSVSNITVSRLFMHGRDTGLVQYLIEQVGKGDVTIRKQPLDVHGNKFSKALVYTGKLKRVQFPEHDSESSDAGMMELEISSASVIGTAS